MTSKNHLKKATQERNRLRSTESEISIVDNNPEQEQDLILSYDPDAIVVGKIPILGTLSKTDCLYSIVAK